ncbi:MAG: GAF domain-containing protein, partial [Acidobacteriota bacterium]|nr:GAF domain-containing protein [Acidobacteriota bacterium]
MNSREPRELELLYRLSQTLGESLELRDVTRPALETLAEHLNLKHGTITLLNRKTGEITIEVAHGLSGEQIAEARYRLGEGVTGQVIETGEARVIPKTSESETFLDRTRRGKSAEVSFLCVPIRTGNETYGALSVDRTYDPDHDLNDDVRLLLIAGSLIAQAVKLRRTAEEEREQLEEENERLRAQLRDRF